MGSDSEGDDVTVVQYTKCPLCCQFFTIFLLHFIRNGKKKSRELANEQQQQQQPKNQTNKASMVGHFVNICTGTQHSHMTAIFETFSASTYHIYR